MKRVKLWLSLKVLADVVELIDAVAVRDRSPKQRSRSCTVKYWFLLTETHCRVGVLVDTPKRLDSKIKLKQTDGI